MVDFLHDFWNLIATTDGLKRLIGWGGIPATTVIVFAETGLLVGFFLPGDSLLFIAGFLASPAGGSAYPIFWLNLCVITGAVVGDALGYWIGYKAGPPLFRRPQSRLFRREHLLSAHEFYERHGGKTIVLARFMPIVRTFAPVVAGAAGMRYRQFVAYNIVGGIGWVLSMTTLGYLLGQIAWVQQNIEKATVLIVLLSVSPLGWHYLRGKLRSPVPKPENSPKATEAG